MARETNEQHWVKCRGLDCPYLDEAIPVTDKYFAKARVKKFEDRLLRGKELGDAARELKCILCTQRDHNSEAEPDECMGYKYYANLEDASRKDPDNYVCTSGKEESPVKLTKKNCPPTQWSKPHGRRRCEACRDLTVDATRRRYAAVRNSGNYTESEITQIIQDAETAIELE